MQKNNEKPRERIINKSKIRIFGLEIPLKCSFMRKNSKKCENSRSWFWDRVQNNESDLFSPRVYRPEKRKGNNEEKA